MKINRLEMPTDMFMTQSSFAGAPALSAGQVVAAYQLGNGSRLHVSIPAIIMYHSQQPIPVKNSPNLLLRYPLDVSNLALALPHSSPSASSSALTPHSGGRAHELHDHCSPPAGAGSASRHERSPNPNPKSPSGASGSAQQQHRERLGGHSSQAQALAVHSQQSHAHPHPRASASHGSQYERASRQLNDLDSQLSPRTRYDRERDPGAAAARSHYRQHEQ